MMSEIKEEVVIFKNSKGEKLWAVLSLPPKKKKVPAVIIVHGFNGSKSNRKFVEAGRKFSQNGIAVLRFDFSGCGESEGDFKNMSIHQETEELKGAYYFLIKQPRVDKSRIGLLGYSLGALIVSLFQTQNPFAKALVLVAPALDQKRLIEIWYSPREIKQWQKKGYLDFPKARIGLKYLNEAKNYTSIVSNIKIPTLILHGNKDRDVPLGFSRRLLKFLAGQKRMITIEGADHNFESYPTKKKLIDYSLKWFRKFLY